MISPYKEHLKQFEGLDNIVTIERNGAPDLTGKVEEVTDFGCTIVDYAGDGNSIVTTFVAYEDIRGVKRLDSAKM